MALTGSAPALDHLHGRDRAVLGREWMLHGHLQDRAGMPLFLARTDRAAMEGLAIDEWMSASPVYTRRMQAALGFGGDDVPTLFKNLQLDIGAPHQFLDFRFRILDACRGEFWLDHCGALMDVEPMGEDFVVGMCHHIEDPTFDATAGAVNPRARIRPLHRPPRVPADRHPHCHWTVTIDPASDPLAEHANVGVVRSSRLASVAARPLEAPAYAGPFDPDFQLEDLAPAAQVVVLEEFAIQAHLLARAYMLAVARTLGDDTAVALGHRTVTGQAGITAERLVATRLHRAGPVAAGPVAAGPVAAGLDSAGRSIAALLQLHPLLHPAGYIDARVSVLDDRRCRLALGPSPVLDEADPYTWVAAVDRHGPGPLDVIARAVDRRAAAHEVAPEGDEARAYEIAVDPGGPPRPEPTEMALVRLSTGAAFRFRTPR